MDLKSEKLLVWITLQHWLFQHPGDHGEPTGKESRQTGHGRRSSGPKKPAAKKKDSMRRAPAAEIVDITMSDDDEPMKDAG